VFHSSTPLLSASGDSPTARPSLWGGGLPPKTVSPNRITRDIKDLLVATVNENPQYQQALVRRMIAGKAPHLETLAAYYTIGKPREQVQVQTSPGVAELLELAHKHHEEKLRSSQPSSGSAGAPDTQQREVDGVPEPEPKAMRH